jgi:hypothetical protein
MNIKKYTLKKDGNGNDQLHVNGKESICPFQPALATPVQNALGQMNLQIMRFCCSTQCPLANIFEDYDEGEQIFKISYQIDCSGTPVIHEIEEEETNNDNTLKIIQ